MRGSTIAALPFLVIRLAAGFHARGATITVDLAGGADFDSIQPAIG